jgi:succinate dehydrogenase / fumarate reductase, membrane anchor subunit
VNPERQQGGSKQASGRDSGSVAATSAAPGTNASVHGATGAVAAVDASSGRGAARPGGGYQQPPAGKKSFEVYSWLFMRVTGLLLIFLALYHLVWWNLVIGVEHLDSQVVIDRWGNPLWRLFNVLLVSFALLHGLNGARYSIDDYVRRPMLRRAVKVVVYTVVLVVLLIGAYALLTFDAASFFASR